MRKARSFFRYFVLKNMEQTKKYGRPRLKRLINFEPGVEYFKPRGVPISSLKIIELSKEEVEAMRLKNIEKMDQRECALKMNTSPATFQRILSRAYYKVSKALCNGNAIKIIKE